MSIQFVYESLSSQILIFVELRNLLFFFHITANAHLQALNLHFSNSNNNNNNNDDDNNNRTQSILFKTKKELLMRQCARSMSVSHFLLSPFC